MLIKTVALVAIISFLAAAPIIRNEAKPPQSNQGLVAQIMAIFGR